jgi:predicted DsbA family dithiol-disulfide isomerase
MMEVKMAIREQTRNGVDAVPYIVFEGRKRDLTLQGAKEVDEY